MKCLSCGKENTHYLCDACRKPEVLDRVFNEIRTYRPETCTNPFLMEYTSGLTEKYAERDIIPEILDLFSIKVSEYYYCRYYRMRRDDRFEESALTYLQNHDFSDSHTQAVLFTVLGWYTVSDIKPISGNK